MDEKKLKSPGNTKVCTGLDYCKNEYLVGK